MTVNQSSPNFPFGKVFGTIFAAVVEPPVPQGPYNRMLWGNEIGKLFDAPFYVDTQRKKVVVDFANSVDTDPHGNFINITGHLYLIQCNRTQCSGCEALESTRLNIGEIIYFTESWLHQTAGVVEFSLTDRVAEDVLSTPLAVMERINSTTCQVLLQERQDGVFVSSVDDPVFRKQPGENWSLTLRAFQFGKPTAGVLLQPVLNIDEEGTGFPKDAVVVSPANTDANGTAQINFASHDPGEPRADQQLDGQVYIYYVNVSLEPGQDSFQALDLTISVHLYSDYKLVGRPTWYKDIYPIFQQYANLYPVMKPIVDLASYEDVTKEPNHRKLKYVFKLPMEHPNYMPVTRDLSPKKREMILSWLDDIDNNEGRPRLGKVDIKLTDLKTALQTAIQLELATIPTYLSALFSIKEGYNEEVAALIQGIVVEEMQHLTLAANVLNAIGGTPVLNTENVAPSYPAALPGGANPELTVTLGRCSLDQIRNMFQKIETPECSLSTSPVTALFHHKNFNYDAFSDKSLKVMNDKCKEASSQINPQTIGAIYIHQILCPMVKLERQANKSGTTIFVGNHSRQLTHKQWYGSTSDVPFAVRDITTAIKAIAYIVMEGEGSDPCNPFDQYGELSHYFKFVEIVHGRRLVRTDDNACSSRKTLKSETATDQPSSEKISSDECNRITYPTMFDDHIRFRPCEEDTRCNTSFHFVGPPISFYQAGVWPTISNPSSDMYPSDSKARNYADIFNKVYTDLLKCLHETVNGQPDRMGDCMGMMKSLKVWADKLVRTPIDPDGDPNIGPNAAPTFEFGGPNM